MNSVLGLDEATPAGTALRYAITEMLNNAIDHSCGTSAEVPQTTRSTRDVFSEFSQDLEFVRTRPVVKLFGLGLRFVSRSEARRMLTGLDEFNQIDIDFADVEDVGQSFVNEVLRVWPQEHPGKTINPINMNDAVEFMVRRGLTR